MYNWKDTRNYRRFRDENGNVIANIIYVDGEEVAVSDEVYEAYASMDRRERYLEERREAVVRGCALGGRLLRSCTLQRRESGGHDCGQATGQKITRSLGNVGPGRSGNDPRRVF